MAFIHSSASKHLFILFVNVGITIFHILGIVYEKYICLEMIPIRIHRIRIDMPWMPIRIRQNYEDLTGSWCITDIFYASEILQCRNMMGSNPALLKQLCTDTQTFYAI